MGEREIRELIDRHWEACRRDDQDGVHEIYRDDCLVHWPQSGEWIAGRKNLQSLREAHPARLEFQIDRVIGTGDLWVTEYVIRYDGAPVNVVSIMEFEDGRVARETHYFADPFDPPGWRKQWVGSIDPRP